MAAERDVAIEILLDPPRGIKTIGDLLDHIEKLDAEGRPRLRVSIPAELQAVRSGRKRDWHLWAGERDAPP